mgnify:CR=1 FL=1
MDNFDLFTFLKDMGEYLFRITESNDPCKLYRYTVVFSDGTYKHFSPDLKTIIAGDGIDLCELTERVENGEEHDIRIADLPEHAKIWLVAEVNESFADTVQYVQTSSKSHLHVTKFFGGNYDDAGVGIYKRGNEFFVAHEDGPKFDLGPFKDAKQVIKATLPARYSLSGPEFHSPFYPL